MAESKRIATPYDQLTYKIIGCAMAVHRSHGPSQRENVYQRDLQEHFLQAGLSFEPQKLYEVYDSLGNGSLIGLELKMNPRNSRTCAAHNPLNPFQKSVVR